MTDEILQQYKTNMNMFINLRTNLFNYLTDHMTHDVDGKFTDAESVWPSEILRIIEQSCND